jgi:thiol-disulfide isomerase/thioredoxin
MKNTNLYLVVFILLLMISHSARGQKLYEIEIIFSGTGVNKVKIGAQVYQGFQSIPLKQDSSYFISEKVALSAKYPIIEVSYFSSKHSSSVYRFFLRNQKCKLIVHSDKDYDIVTVEKTSGVTSFEDGGLNEFKVFAKAELETRDAYARAYNYDFTEVDSSVLNNFTKYSDAVKQKSFQFVRKYPGRLYNNWLFIYQILGDPRYSNDELLDLYNRSLKPRHKDTFEEKLILNKLDPSRLALNTIAPLRMDTFIDLKGTKYSISSFKSRLVLVNIWATWCKPCVAELPRLKELYSKYKNFLEILSFSTDTEEQKLRGFIEAKDINWINVFNQPKFCNAFGSDMGIPQLFLLNEKGIILYSRFASSDASLDILDKTLARFAENQNSKH